MINKEKLWRECESVIQEIRISPDYFQRRVLGIRNTLPQILMENWKADPMALSMRKKNLGIWNTYTWDQVYESIKFMAMGLKGLDIQRADKVCIIGDNDPEWYWAELAAQSVGAVVVGFYIDAMPADIEYITSHSDTVLVFAKDQEQVDKFLEVKEKIPRVRKVIYWDPKGMINYKGNPWLMELSELMEMGKALNKKDPQFFEKSVEEGTEKELAVLCYTSGTTGLPKGVMISHEYLIKATIRLFAMTAAQEKDEYLSFVPPAWIAEQIMLGGWLIFDIKVNFPEEPETVLENIREIGPRTLLLAPMQWLGLISRVQMKIFDTGALRKLLYIICLQIGYRIADYKLKYRKPPPFYWKIFHSIANKLCLHHIRDHLGLSKTRTGITGGSALGPDAFRWFLALGVNIKDAYGLTEIDPITCHAELVKPGTSGRPIPGVEIKISEGGEILARSDGMFNGYYKDDAATAAMVAEGWVKTGDCGTLDEDGQLIVYDRMKDMLPMKSGKYSPTYIQNRLKFSPYIKDAMIIGGEEKDFLFAIITIDFDNVGKWAEKNRFSYTTFVDLSQKDEVYGLIENDVLQVNTTLPEGAQIGRYTLLHKEFDPDEGELTKTRKLRRAFLEKRYGELIEAAYSGQEKITTEATVKYRDGREGRVKTDLKIRTLN